MPFMIPIVLCLTFPLVIHSSLDNLDLQENELDFMPIPELLFHHPNSSVTLQCPFVHTQDYPKKVKIKWEFQKCSFLKPGSCANYYESTYKPWPVLTSCLRNHSCETLTLKNVTEEKSGLYRCLVTANSKASIYPYVPKVITVYKLMIMEKKGAPPKILEVNPSILTVAEGNSIVLQCRVESVIQVTVTWFRYYDNVSTCGNCCIKYDGNYFEVQRRSQLAKNDGGVMRQSNNVYISKLVLSNPTVHDSRKYICLAANQEGVDYGEIFLAVTPSYEKSSDAILFLYLLFLIPLTLALVPIIFWLCYMHHQKKQLKKTAEHDVLKPFYDNNNPHNDLQPRCKYKQCKTNQSLLKGDAENTIHLFNVI